VELKRILAKDSRRALEKVSNEYGKEALVISSAKVNGQTEVIVAIDLHSETPVQSLALENSTEKEHLTPTVQVGSNFEKLLNSEISTRSKSDLKLNEHSDSRSGKKADDMEYIRMREIVDLIKLELSSIRKEFKLSQKLKLTENHTSICDAIIPLVRFFEDSGMPSSLKTLLSGELSEETDLQVAIKKSEEALAKGLSSERIDWEENKLHVLAGTSGSGKSLMTGKLAAELARQRSSEQVAIISYKDKKLGAWAQSQLIGAETGVSTYKVDSYEVLKALVDELGSDKTIIIDTPGINIPKHLTEIKNLDGNPQFHLVVPFDASESSVYNAISQFEKSWSSIMISRSDEKVLPWPLVSVLTNARLPISYIGSGSTSLSTLSEAVPKALVKQALAEFSTDFDCESLIIENKQYEELKSSKNVKKQNNLEVKAGQIDPEMMLSDPLMMISKMVENRHGVTEVI